jgi:pimeloyl-ACP methyl ester carboxylesterase
MPSFQANSRKLHATSLHMFLFLTAVCAAVKASKVHLIHGDADETIPVADAQIFHKHLPASTLDIIAGGTHSFRTVQEGQDLLIASVQQALLSR